MSIKVLRHGDTIAVTNPVTGKEQVMVNVTFMEEGARGGADAQMSETSDFLSEIVGQEVGLQTLRIHTHPVLRDKIELFPVGSNFPGFINRGMYSTPQLRQQENVAPRMIDGRPTYFKTWIGRAAEADVDKRIDNDVLVDKSPGSVFGAQIGATQSRVVSIDSRQGPQPINGNTGGNMSQQPESVANTGS